MPRKQPPQCLRMALYAVRTADHQDGRIQHLQGAFHLGRKIHMAGRVQQGYLRIPERHDGLFGENCDTALTFKGIRIQKRIAMIHAAKSPHRAAAIQQRFRKRRLARIHMGQQTRTNMFFCFSRFLLAHKNAFFRDCILF